MTLSMQEKEQRNAPGRGKASKAVTHVAAMNAEYNWSPPNVDVLTSV